MPRPHSSEISPFQQKYIDHAIGNDALDVINQSVAPLKDFLHSLPESKANFAYASGKWTLVQLLQHLVDTERILAFRALCIARGEHQNLPGFDENDYAAHAPANNRTVKSLSEEMLLIRQTTLLLYQSFSDDDLARQGLANGHSTSANALAFILVGHALHHRRLVLDWYL